MASRAEYYARSAVPKFIWPDAMRLPEDVRLLRLRYEQSGEVHTQNRKSNCNCLYLSTVQLDFHNVGVYHI